MKRTLRKILLFGVLGGLASYLVAWVLLIDGQHSDRWTITSTSWRADTTDPKGQLAVQLYSDAVKDDVAVMWSGVDNFHWAETVDQPFDHLPFWARFTPLARGPTRPSSGTPPFRLSYTWVIAAGWPCRCVASMGERRSQTGLDGSWGAETPEWERGRFTLPTTFLPGKRWPSALTLYWYPLWPGLLANAALYGLLIWLSFFTCGRLRRTLRHRRGRCIHCGYDLRGNSSEACPECGTPRNSGTRGRAVPHSVQSSLGPTG